MFRVKICGITNLDDALAAAAAGAGAIGLNCYSGSPRYCHSDLARQIAQAVPQGVCKVGVFVNATADEIRSAVESIGLDLVQLHGDEPPELLKALQPLPIMKAFRLGDRELSWKKGPGIEDRPPEEKGIIPISPTTPEAVGEYLRQCHRLVCVPRMVMVDALRPGHYGGTSATLDWQALRAARHHFAGAPLVLAGGLKPSNVQEAIATARPWAVDTASGVESSVGKKSTTLVREFIAAANEAFAQPAGRT